MKFKREGIYVLITIIVVSSCTVIYYTFNENEKTTLIGIAVAVGIFFTEKNYQASKRESEFKEILGRCYKTIKKELKDHETALKSTEYEVVMDNKDYQFKSMFLNVDAYESLLNSGLYTHFPTDTQHILANLYIRIKLHNEYQIQRSVLRSIFLINKNNKDESWPVVISSCDVILNRYQNEIVKSIKVVNKLIKEDQKELSLPTA